MVNSENAAQFQRKRIFEFTDKKIHRGNSEKSVEENPFIYKTHYPGFQNPKKHPENLYVPCCFQNPSTLFMVNIN